MGCADNLRDRKTDLTRELIDEIVEVDFIEDVDREVALPEGAVMV